MLEANKVVKTPEQKKKEKAARIKAHAMEIFNLSIAEAMRQGNQAMAAAYSAGGDEAMRPIKQTIRVNTVHSAIDSAIVFDTEWLKRRGEMLHDDA